MMRCLFLLCTACFLVTNCNDEDAVISNLTGVVLEGTAANGFEQCGWLIEAKGTRYLPNVLNSQFRKEGLKVALKVEFLGKLAGCSPAKTAPERIRIEQIRVIN